MNNQESIFDQYPRRDGFTGVIPDDPVGAVVVKTLLGSANFFTTENYQQLPDTATPKDQLDNLDATLGRKISTFGRGVILFCSGITAAVIGSEVSDPKLQTSLAIGGMIGATLGLMKVGIERSDIFSVEEVHTYNSRVRSLSGWLTLPFSKKLYENIRNRQISKRNTKLVA